VNPFKIAAATVLGVVDAVKAAWTEFKVGLDDWPDLGSDYDNPLTDAEATREVWEPDDLWAAESAAFARFSPLVGNGIPPAERPRLDGSRHSPDAPGRGQPQIVQCPHCGIPLVCPNTERESS